MKTLHMTNAWHGDSGGVATFYRALAASAGENDHSIRLIVPAAVDRVEDVNPWARIYHLRSPKAPFSSNYRLLLPHRLMLPGSAGHTILRNERPDLIEVCDKYSLHYVAALLRKGWLPRAGFRPATVGISCERMDITVRAYAGPSPTLQTLARWYMKWLYFPFFDHHITVSGHTSEELLEAARGHKVRRGVWIRPMGVDAGLFTPARRRPEQRKVLIRQATAEQHCALLLYAGRLAPEKNIELLAGIMECLVHQGRAVHLIIAGDGPLLHDFQQQCARRVPGAVTFLGHIRDRERLANVYANCDAFIHPNPNEPFGIAPLEAMASGTPVIAPNIGGMTEYVRRGNAWLADMSTESFARCVKLCLDDPDARAERVHEARRTAEQHGWDSVAAQFFALYRELHAISTGAKQKSELAPAFASTPGNWLGIED